MQNLCAVGKRIPKIDAVEKATGRAHYIQDLKLPGMLHGKILYSKFPHARIVKIDASKARALPGVRAVITGADIPEIKMGVYKDNRPSEGGKSLLLSGRSRGGGSDRSPNRGSSFKTD
jgi:CO/xanthine dehydrogenase Mo-binding subunit